MQVEYLARISLPDDGWDVNMLEEGCWKAGREASQRLFLSVLERRDREVTSLAEGEEKSAEKVLVCSSGAMEKNIDVVIDRRFKRLGMSWTMEVAHNLLKLRTLWYNKTDWEAFWTKQSSYGVSFSPN